MHDGRDAAPLPSLASRLVDMLRRSKILAVQSLLLVISRLLLAGFTWQDVTCTPVAFMSLV